MVWDYDECYIKYQQVSKFLCDMLGISQLDCDLIHACYLPYYTQIIDFLNTRLIQLGTDDIKARVQEVFDIADWGATLYSHGLTFLELLDLDLNFSILIYLPKILVNVRIVAVVVPLVKLFLIMSLGTVESILMMKSTIEPTMIELILHGR